MLLAQTLDDAQDLVVRLAGRQAGGQFEVEPRGLKEQAATGSALACRIQGNPQGDVGARCGHQGVERAADLAAIARHFGHAFLVAVELFEHDHRQIDVVFLEAEQAGRIVQQHVGVQHEQFLGTGAALFAFACRACGSGGRSGCGRSRNLGSGDGLGRGWLGRGLWGCRTACARLCRRGLGRGARQQCDGGRSRRQGFRRLGAAAPTARRSLVVKSVLIEKGGAPGGGGGQGHGANGLGRIRKTKSRLEAEAA